MEVCIWNKGLWLLLLMEKVRLKWGIVRNGLILSFFEVFIICVLNFCVCRDSFCLFLWFWVFFLGLGDWGEGVMLELDCVMDLLCVCFLIICCGKLFSFCVWYLVEKVFRCRDILCVLFDILLLIFVILILKFVVLIW